MSTDGGTAAGGAAAAAGAVIRHDGSGSDGDGNTTVGVGVDGGGAGGKDDVRLCADGRAAAGCATGDVGVSDRLVDDVGHGTLGAAEGNVGDGGVGGESVCRGGGGAKPVVKSTTD